MAKVELTLTSTYLREWRLNEAIREIVQNARDSDLDGHRMRFEHKGEKLIVSNEGVVLDHSVFLLGKTGKAGHPEAAGKFGEGLKLAMLVCAREEIPMVIRNGSEVWEPKIEASERFAGEEVLVIHIRKGNAFRDRFQVEIAFPLDVWEENKWKYLFCEPPPRKEVVNTPTGKLLLGEKYKGCIFVKGIFVCRAGVDYGYDFNQAELDRDRRVMSSWDIQANARPILLAAANRGEGIDHLRIYEMMRQESADAKVSSWESVSDDMSDIIRDTFVKLHGQDAVPVRTTAESSEMEHLGKKGVLVGETLSNVLRRSFGDIDKLRKELSGQVTSQVSWHEMTAQEKHHLKNAIDCINQADPDLKVNLSNVEVVTFRDGRMMGMFKDGKALLSRHVLADHVDTMSTLVHEVAHRKGPDGDKAHVQEIERIWSAIFRQRCTM